MTDQARSELAHELLQDSECSLGEIAERLGYFNQGDFSRAWKRWTGVSPQRFRQDPGGSATRRHAQTTEINVTQSSKDSQ